MREALESEAIEQWLQGFDPSEYGSEPANIFSVFGVWSALIVALDLFVVAWYALFSMNTHDQSRYIETRLLRTSVFDVAVESQNS